MPTSNPYYIPQIQMTGLRNVPKYDPFLGLREAMLMQRAMQARSGGGGRGSGVPQEGDLRYGRWVTLPDGTQKWVWGKTDKERSTAEEAARAAYVRGVLESDPEYKKAVEGISQLSVPGQRDRIAKLRAMAPRLAPKLGMSELDAVKFLTADASKAVTAREKEISRADNPFWGSLARGASNLWDAITHIGDTAPERIARAKAVKAEERAAAEENAFLDEIERRRREGIGTAGLTLGTWKGLTNLAGQSLTDLGATITAQGLGGWAGAAGGALLGGVLGGPAGAAWGGRLGAALGAGAGGAAINGPLASEQFAQRIADDGTISDAEKIRMIENSNAGLYGAAVGAAVSSPAALAGRALSVVPGKIGATATRLSTVPAASTTGAIVKGVAQNAVDAAALGAADLMTQNLAYNQATGRDIPLTEGLGEAIASGAILGLPFGLARGFGAKARRAAWEKNASETPVEETPRNLPPVQQEPIVVEPRRVQGQQPFLSGEAPRELGWQFYNRTLPFGGGPIPQPGGPEAPLRLGPITSVGMTPTPVLPRLPQLPPGAATGFGPIANGMTSTGIPPIALGNPALPVVRDVPLVSPRMAFDTPALGVTDVPVQPTTPQSSTPNIKSAKNVQQLRNTLAKADDPIVLRTELDTLSAKNWKRKYVEARIGELENGNTGTDTANSLIGQTPRLEPVRPVREGSPDNANTLAGSPAAAVAEAAPTATPNQLPGALVGSNPADQGRGIDGPRAQDTGAVATPEGAPLEQGVGRAEGPNGKSGAGAAASVGTAAGESTRGVEPAERSGAGGSGNEPAVSAEQPLGHPPVDEAQVQQVAEQRENIAGTPPELRVQPTDSDAVVYEKILGQLQNAGRPTAREEAAIAMRLADTLGSVSGETPAQIMTRLNFSLNEPVEAQIRRSLDQTAWHGTPYEGEIRALSTEYIGSGEGAQLHGWGLYVALDEAVSKDFYQHKLADQMGLSDRIPQVKVIINGEPVRARTEFVKHPDGRWWDETYYEFENAVTGEWEPFDITTPRFNNNDLNPQDLYGLIEYTRNVKALNKDDILKQLQENIAYHDGLLQRAVERAEDIKNRRGDWSNYTPYLANEYLKIALNDIKIQKELRLQYMTYYQLAKRLDFTESKGAWFGQRLRLEIPEDDVMLREEALLSAQSEYVRSRLNELYNSAETPEAVKTKMSLVMGREPSGLEVYIAITKGYSIMFEQGAPAASQLLDKFGIKGIRYNGNRDGECAVLFDGKYAKILERFYDQQGRGRVDFMQDGTARILFTQNADASTAIHEFQHFFTNEAGRILHDPTIADSVEKRQLAADMETLGRWAGETENIADPRSWSTEAQEKSAKAFEHYFRTGKAPTPELKSLFQRMKELLMQIYRKAKDILGIGKLPKNITEVFDRELTGYEGLTRPVREADIIKPGEPLDAPDYIDPSRNTLDSMAAVSGRLSMVDEEALTKIMKNKDAFDAEAAAEKLIARKSLGDKLKPAEEKQYKALLKEMGYDAVTLSPGEIANVRRQYNLAKEQGLNVSEVEMATKTTAEAQRKVTRNPACGV